MLVLTGFPQSPKKIVDQQSGIQSYYKVILDMKSYTNQNSYLLSKRHQVSRIRRSLKYPNSITLTNFQQVLGGHFLSKSFV
jgi:hypothetical protein